MQNSHFERQKFTWRVGTSTNTLDLLSSTPGGLSPPQTHLPTRGGEQSAKDDRKFPDETARYHFLTNVLWHQENLTEWELVRRRQDLNTNG